MAIEYYKCPTCNNFTILANRIGALTEWLCLPILPKSKEIRGD